MLSHFSESVSLVPGSGATVLQKAKVRIINSTVCNALMSGQITSRMMCAGKLDGGVDACQVHHRASTPYSPLSHPAHHLTGMSSSCSGGSDG